MIVLYILLISLLPFIIMDCFIFKNVWDYFIHLMIAPRLEKNCKNGAEKLIQTHLREIKKYVKGLLLIRSIGVFNRETRVVKQAVESKKALANVLTSSSA